MILTNASAIPKVLNGLVIIYTLVYQHRVSLPLLLDSHKYVAMLRVYIYSKILTLTSLNLGCAMSPWLMWSNDFIRLMKNNLVMTWPTDTTATP